MKKITRMSLILVLPVLIFAQQELTLEQCHELALKNNYQIKIANEEVKTSENNVKSSRTMFLPKISLAGTYLHSNKKFEYTIDEMSLPVTNADGSLRADQYTIITGADGESVKYPLNWIHIDETDISFGQKNYYLVNLGLVQPVFTGGKIVQQYKISKSAAKISQAKKSLTNSEVLMKTDELFWKIISVEEKVKLAKEYVALIEEHITNLNNYLSEGLITSNDMLKADVKLNEAKMNLLKAQNGRDLAKMAMCQHLGMPLKSKIQLQDKNSNEYLMINDNNSSDEYVANRNEIKMLQESVNISKSMEKIAYSQYMPNIVFTSNYLTTNPNPYNSFEEEFGSDWNIGLTAEIELFNWNDRGHKVASARHSRKAVEQKFEDTKNLIKLDIQQSIYKVNESIKRINLAESTLLQAEKNMNITQDNFKEGIATSTDVLDAQILWQKAKSEVIDSKSEYKINLAKYYKAIGQN